MSTVAPPLERALRRDGTIGLAALALLWLLTIAWIAAGAGLGMDPWDMTAMASLPQHHAAPRGDMSTMDMSFMDATWNAAHWSLMFGMWWTMMVAMMMPSAAPAILLHARVHRHALMRGQVAAPTPPTAAFAAGYLLAWGVFSLAATAVQFLLEATGVLSAMTMGAKSTAWSAALLVATGAFQLSPWKRTCLSHCRAPAAFLARHARPGTRGALRLGLLHGAYCVGCCGLLMGLLFVGGVMNLIWIAALTAVVVAEQRLPAGRHLGTAVGVGLIAWGVWLAVS